MADEESAIQVKGYYRWHNLPAMLFIEQGEEKSEAYRPPEGYIAIPVADLDDAEEINRMSFELMVDLDQGIYEADKREAEAEATNARSNS